jgi:hypothetical protein
MIDKRLLGTWQSDLRRTAREARDRHLVPEEKIKKFKLLFGKLRLRITRTRIYSDFKGEKSVEPYRVVAKDAYSVAIVTRGLVEEEQIYHVHFEGKYHWVWPDTATFPEYFKRVDP